MSLLGMYTDFLDHRVCARLALVGCVNSFSLWFYHFKLQPAKLTVPVAAYLCQCLVLLPSFFTSFLSFPFPFLPSFFSLSFLLSLSFFLVFPTLSQSLSSALPPYLPPSLPPSFLFNLRADILWLLVPST